jgi:hypothetical protein
MYGIVFFLFYYHDIHNHTHEPEIEPLTICLKRPNFLPFRLVHCWCLVLYFYVAIFIIRTLQILIRGFQKFIHICNTLTINYTKKILFS